MLKLSLRSLLVIRSMKRGASLLLPLLFCLLALRAQPPEKLPPVSHEYALLQKHLARGWNTWDVNSVLTQVLLPEGLAIHIGIQNRTTEAGEAFLPNALIGREDPGAEKVKPGPHSYDGSYTDLQLSWRGHEMRIQSAHTGGDLVLLATPLPSNRPSSVPPAIVFSVNFLWNRPGSAQKHGNRMDTHGSSGQVPVFFVGKDDLRTSAPVSGPYFASVFDKPVAISTGKQRTLQEIQAVLQSQQKAYDASNVRNGRPSPVANAIQTVMGWDTIFDPEHDRVITPVSRIWSVNWGGYVLFDWDTFFGATLAAVGDRDLAYANAVEILREITPAGFVPNYARARGWKSFDRSEPPVGSITVLGLYRKFHDRWFLEETFDPLLRWNRWWSEHRDMDGYLVWGSDAENRPRNPDDSSVGTLQAAKFESGLDNSPMYDGAFYNPATHQMEFADVGLMSMYIADCDALAKIADILGKQPEAHEIHSRAAKYRHSLATLWDPKTGMFLNKDLHTGKFSHRLSPTNFYPLLARAATSQQAARMIHEHLLNPKEFWGKWVIPSIARDDPAFKDQNYWRGRIWGPMNYLVYLGLRNYNFPTTRREFARKSLALFLREWRKSGHVHENYNAITGWGDDVKNSDRFYDWGALLGLIQYRETTEPVSGQSDAPER
ncbi:MAG: MGH1-like glycoside hydrolase domain-containing protein [Bryobacteraceae bacterium]